MLITNDDRRTFRRMVIEEAVTIKLANSELQGTCKELSSTGMSIQLIEPNLKQGDQVQIFLDTQDSRFPPLDVKGVVLRINEQDGAYIVAVEFQVIK